MFETFVKNYPLWPLQPLLIMLRITVGIYCFSAAASLNKNKVKWGLLGFFVPIITIIWIQFVKPDVEVVTTGKG